MIIRSGSMGVAGAGARVFVLDMGEPVKIKDLARAMIELSGLDPERDIDIEITGRRPGEKIEESLFNDWETERATQADKIMLAERPSMTTRAVESAFAEVARLVEAGDVDRLAARVCELTADQQAEESPAPQAANDGGAPAALVHSQGS